MRVRNLCFSLFGTVALFACNGPARHEAVNTQATADSLNKILDDYYEDEMRMVPVVATFLGDNRYNDQLPVDIGQAWRNELDSLCAGYQVKLRALDTSALSPNDRISRDMLLREVTLFRKGLTFHDELTPVNQFSCITLMLAQLGSGQSAQPFANQKDYENFMSRMRHFAEWSDTAIANMRRGMAQNYVLPKALVVKIIPQLKDLSSPDTAKNVFFAPLKKLPDSLAPVSQAALRKAYDSTIRAYILPSYAKLARFLQEEYLPKARTSSGVGALPDGAGYYAYQIQNYTTTDKTPEEIFNLGQSEVARIRKEMEAVKDSVGFKGDLKAFFTFMRTDKQFNIFKDDKSVIDSFQAIYKRIKPKVDELYGHQPKTPFEIRQTEAFRAASASAEYNPGSPDGKRPGIFYVPILDAKKFSYVGMESLFLHEAIPGHHFQISLQQEDTLLPKYRRFNGNSAYQEGYALYCESLGKQLGLYTNPYQYFGRLSDEMLRAVRLVVDAGMHSKGWTREQAIQFMEDNLSTPEHEIVSEVERYMAIPGQALAYKVGELKIEELRDKYKKSMGSKFSLRDFHDELLKDGALPLSILEEKMDRWAASR